MPFVIAIIIIILRVVFEAGELGTGSTKYKDSNHKRTTLSYNDQIRQKRQTVFSELNAGVSKMEETEPETAKEVKEALVEAERQMEKQDFYMPKPPPEPKVPLYTDTVVEEEPEIDDEFLPINPVVKLEFMILMLVYVMYEDDGEFSRKEKKIVTSVLKAMSSRITTKDRIRIEQKLDSRPNLDTLFDFVHDNNISSAEVYKITGELRKTTKKEGYEKVFRRIENRITYEL